MILGMLTALALTSEPDTERRYEATVPEPGARTVQVTHSGGDCTVLPLGPDEAPRAELKVLVSGDNTGQEADYLDKIRLTAVPQTEHLLVRSVFPAPETKPPSLSVAAHLTLWLPASTALEIDSRYGTVEVRGLQRSVSIRNRLGPVRARDLAGALTVVNEYDRVEIQNVRGRIEVQNSDAVLIEGARDEVRVINKFGSVRVVDATGPVHVENRNAPIDLARVTGGAEVIAPYCRVTIDRAAGNLHVSGSNADVEVSGVEGALRLDHRHGELRVSDVRDDLIIHGSFIPMNVRRIGGDVEIRSTASSIVVDDVAGSAVVDGETGSMELRNIRGNLNASGKGGLMLVAFPVVPEPIDGWNYQLMNRSSPMELEVPENLSCTLSVQSTLGVVECEYPDLQTEQNGRVRFGTLVLGDGEMAAEGVCVDGAIRIRRATDR